MLKKRVITSIFLAIALVADTFLPTAGFAVSMALLLMVAAWEWSNLAGLDGRVSRLCYVLLMPLVFLLVTKLPILTTLSVVCAFWGAAFFAIVTYPRTTAYWQHSVLRALIGVVVLSGTWLSFVELHQKNNGVWWVLLLWGIVAIADIGAYAVGHAIGKTKLAPQVSPGKTREGAYGGIVLTAVIISAAAFWCGADTLYIVKISAIAVLVAMASVVGDLFESMLKRFRGIKDSGQILPGHGGVLDRIDGWTAAAPVYTVLHIYFDLGAVAFA